MTNRSDLGLLLLHALPLDGSMWARQRELVPGATYAPTLYAFGDSLEAWAPAALEQVKEDRLIVVGCSVGGSCAIEVAVAAPDRVAALVLIGTKASHRPDPALHSSALSMLHASGVEEAWAVFWAPLFARSASSEVVSEAKRIALDQLPRDVARGVTAFHTRPSRDQFLETSTVPVIMVTGADDRAPGLKLSATQANLASQGRLHVIPDCGHYVPLEKPELLNSILRDVIASL
jgi:pimeloyl-ACP methyl ester carboxylesterase